MQEEHLMEIQKRYCSSDLKIAMQDTRSRSETMTIDESYTEVIKLEKSLPYEEQPECDQEDISQRSANAIMEFEKNEPNREVDDKATK